MISQFQEIAASHASLLPLAEAIGKLPVFGSLESGCDYTQRHPQTPDHSMPSAVAIWHVLGGASIVKNRLSRGVLAQ